MKDFVKPSERVKLPKLNLSYLINKMILDEQSRLEIISEYAKKINENIRILEKKSILTN